MINGESEVRNNKKEVMIRSWGEVQKRVYGEGVTLDVIEGENFDVGKV